MSPPTRRALLATAAAATICRAGPADAATVLRIGVLTDLSGPLRDTTGPGSVAGATLAAREFAAANPGVAVQVIAADHQNKPDIGVGIARQWFDRDGVDAITDVGNSAVALGCSTVAADKDKVLLAASPGLGDLTGKACTPNTVHWTFNTYAIAHTIGSAVVRLGGATWFIVAPDYAGGQTLQDTTAGFVAAAGGTVVGSVRYPFPDTRDFSSFLLQAQASGAKVVAFANGGDDMVNCVKQAHEFGLTQGGQQLVVLASNALSIALAGLEAMGGRDRDRDVLLGPERPHAGVPQPGAAADAGRAVPQQPARRQLRRGAPLPEGGGRHRHRGRASASGRAAVAAMKAMPTDDDCFGPGSVRADGRVIHPNYLFQAKTPAESRGWDDVLRLLATTPADEAFAPLSRSACTLAGG